MPVILKNDYRPSIFLRNGHTNTLYSYFFRKRKLIPWCRIRVNTPDQDFYDVDWLKHTDNHQLVILLHGLEGSSASQYINGLAPILYDKGFDIAAINFRSCSGVSNLQLDMYHSGYTKDLSQFIDTETDSYSTVVICGFSLGGNVTMKYAGQSGTHINPKIKAVIGVSVPCDLRPGSARLKRWYNYPYEQNFIGSLMKKMAHKATLFPDIVNMKNASRVHHLWDFDDYYTAPLHGFEDAEDYYRQSNSKQFLAQISIAALMINAQDDTFLTKECFPYEVAEEKDNFYLMAPKYGGHCGFAQIKKGMLWSEIVITDFILDKTR